MSYNTDLITTEEQCNFLIKETSDEKSQLDTQIINGERRLNSQTERAADVEEIQTRKAFLTPLIATITDQKVKAFLQRDLNKLIYRENNLAVSESSDDGTDRLETQHDLRCAQILRDEKIAFLAALEARKAQLIAAAGS